MLESSFNARRKKTEEISETRTGFDRSRSKSRDKQLREYIRCKSKGNIKFRSKARVSADRDGIRCFRCTEYDNFARCYANTAVAEKDQLDKT